MADDGNSVTQIRSSADTGSRQSPSLNVSIQMAMDRQERGAPETGLARAGTRGRCSSETERHLRSRGMPGDAEVRKRADGGREGWEGGPQKTNPLG